VHWCVDRSVDEGWAASWTSSSSSSASMDSFSPCGVLLDESCDSDEVFLSDGEDSAPSRRNVRRQMHSFRSVECLSMLLKSCTIVIKWDVAKFMAVSMHLLGLHLLRMPSENSLFEFIMPSLIVILFIDRLINFTKCLKSSISIEFKTK